MSDGEEPFTLLLVGPNAFSCAKLPCPIKVKIFLCTSQALVFVFIVLKLLILHVVNKILVKPPRVQRGLPQQLTKPPGVTFPTATV
jgi:hypothetical protein